ncbi:MAG: hypothetical protein WCJ58_04815 [bacterium]
MKKKIIFTAIILIGLFCTLFLLYKISGVHLLPETGTAIQKKLGGQLVCDEPTANVDWTKVKINLVFQENTGEKLVPVSLSPTAQNNKQASWNYLVTEKSQLKSIFVTTTDNYQIPCTGLPTATNCTNNNICSCGDTDGHAAYAFCNINDSKSEVSLDFHIKTIAAEKAKTVVFSGMFDCASSTQGTSSAKIWLNYLNSQGIEYQLYSSVNKGGLWRSYAQHLSELKSITIEDDQSCSGTMECPATVPSGCSCTPVGSKIKYTCSEFDNTEEISSVDDLNFYVK